MIRAQVTPQQAVELAKTHFGVAATAASRLDGYDDANFRLTLSQGGSKQYVFKVVNTLDSAAEGFSEAQSSLLLFLAEKGIPVNCPQLSVSGSYTVYTLGQEPGSRHALRLLTWLPGTLLKDVDPQTMELYHAVGAFMGRVNSVLSQFDHPALHREHNWNLDCLPATYAATRQALVAAGVTADMQLLDAVAQHYEQQMKQAGNALRRQIIHSDANESNVLISSAADGVAGLLDFGDTCHQVLANEPAITAVYISLEHMRLGGTDALAAASAVLRGYCSELALLPEERKVLRTLMMGRLVQSLSLGLKAAHEQPENTEYLLRTQGHGWALLHVLWEMSEASFQTVVWWEGNKLTSVTAHPE